MCDCETNKKCSFVATWKERIPKWLTWWKGFDLGPAGCSKIGVEVWGMCGGSRSRRAGILFFEHTSWFLSSLCSSYLFCIWPARASDLLFIWPFYFIVDTPFRQCWHIPLACTANYQNATLFFLCAGKGIPQTASTSTSPVLHDLRVVCSQRVQWTELWNAKYVLVTGVWVSQPHHFDLLFTHSLQWSTKSPSMWMPAWVDSLLLSWTRQGSP